MKFALEKLAASSKGRKGKHSNREPEGYSVLRKLLETGIDEIKRNHYPIGEIHGNR